MKSAITQPCAPQAGGSRADDAEASTGSARATTQSTGSTALYIHWPFCKKKCPYCDFNSHVREQIDHERWRAALLREMNYWHHRAPDNRITSIFFGGGTPSLMHPATVAALIEEADKRWGLAADCEITLEANPTSVEAANFKILAASGVNRVSLGVQSLKPQSLAFLGREHSAGEALAAVALAAAAFPRYSFDLIYALPGQTLTDWETELREALTHASGHLSLYQLTIEENTAFHHAYHVGKSFQLPEDSLAADLYLHTQQIMEQASLPAYEISNHAAPGQESIHNLTYWNSAGYFGIGPGAHGRVDLGGVRHATHTLKSPERYLAQIKTIGHGMEEEAILTPQDRTEETLLMGLRLAGGVEVSKVSEEVLTHPARTRLLDQGYLEHTQTHLKTTLKGKLVLNHILQELLT